MHRVVSERYTKQSNKPQYFTKPLDLSCPEKVDICPVPISSTSNSSAVRRPVGVFLSEQRHKHDQLEQGHEAVQALNHTPVAVKISNQRVGEGTEYEVAEREAKRYGHWGGDVVAASAGEVDADEQALQHEDHRGANAEGQWVREEEMVLAGCVARGDHGEEAEGDAGHEGEPVSGLGNEPDVEGRENGAEALC